MGKHVAYSSDLEQIPAFCKENRVFATDDFFHFGTYGASEPCLGDLTDRSSKLSLPFDGSSSFALMASPLLVFVPWGLVKIRDVSVFFVGLRSSRATKRGSQYH